MNKYFLIHIKKCAFSESVFNTLYIEIKHKFEKISLGQNKRYKNAGFFSLGPPHHWFTFDLRFLYELKHKVRLSKTMCGIFYFRFRFVFKFIFLFNKMHALFDFKTS